MALSTRQPFAELGTPRLQALSSAKNRQNGKQLLAEAREPITKREIASYFARLRLLVPAEALFDPVYWQAPSRIRV